jgi:hypothetical protein
MADVGRRCLAVQHEQVDVEWIDISRRAKPPTAITQSPPSALPRARCRPRQIEESPDEPVRQVEFTSFTARPDGER